MEKFNLKHNPIIRNEEDCNLLLNYAKWAKEIEQFPELSQEYRNKIENIKEIKGIQGYAVLEDNTILVDPYTANSVAEFDGCTEDEMRMELWARIKGY